MDWQTSLHLLPPLFSFCMSAGIGAYALTRSVPGSKPFGYMALLQAGWILGYVFEMMNPSLDGKLFWDNIQWIFTVFTPLAFLSFALQYTESRMPYSRLIHRVLLFLIPIFLVLLYTNDAHGLMVQNARLVEGEPYSSLVYDFPPLLLGFSAVFYGIFFLGFANLVVHFFNSQEIVRSQVLAIFLGGLIPLIGTIFTLMDVVPASMQRDLSPYTFGIGNLLIGWALFRYRMLNIAPMARNVIFESMMDGFVVLSDKNIVMDINPAAARILGLSGVQTIGRPARDVFMPWPRLVESLDTTNDEAKEVFIVGTGEGQRNYVCFISPLNDRLGRFMGRVVTFRKMGDASTYPVSASVKTPVTHPQPGVGVEPENQTTEKPEPQNQSRWFAGIVKFFFPPLRTDLLVPPGQELIWYRTLERTLTTVLRLGFILVLLTVIALKPLFQDFPAAYTVFQALVVILGLLGIFRRIPFEVRSVGFVSVFYLFGIIETLIFGFTAESFVFFMVFAVSVGTLAWGRTRRIALSVSFVSIAVLGWMIFAVPSIPLAGDRIHMAAYQSARLLPTLISLAGGIMGLTLATTSIWETARRVWRRERQTSNLMKQERDMLEIRVQERTRELAEAEVKYRQLIEQLPMAVYQDEPNLESTNIYLSPQIEWLLGYPMEEWKDELNLWQTILHPEDREIANAGLRHVLEHGQGSTEYRVFNKQGAVVWLRDDSVLFRDETGKPKVVQGTLSDVTARTLALKRQHEIEKLMMQVMENLNEVFWVSDPFHKEEIYFSPSAEKIWGRPPSELVDSLAGFFATIVVDDLPTVLEAYEKESQGEGTDIKYRIVRPDGTMRWVWERGFAIFDETGRVDRIAGFTSDITDLKSMQEALETSEVRYRGMFENSPVSLWEEDFSGVKSLLDGLAEQGVTDYLQYFADHPEFVELCVKSVKVLKVNEATARLYHAKSKEDVLNNFVRLFDDQSLNDFKFELLNIAQGNLQFNWIGENLRLTGAPMQVHIQWSVMPGYEQTLSQVLLSITDITQEVQAQKVLQQRNKEYEVMSAIAVDLLNRRSFAELLQSAVDSAALLLDSPISDLKIVEGERLFLKSFSGMIFAPLGDEVLRKDAKLSWQAHDTGKPVVLDNYSGWEERRRIFDEAQLQAVAEFPVMAGGKCVAVLGVARVRPNYPFDEHHLQLGQWLTQLLALVLDNIQLLDTTKLQVSALNAAANAMMVIDREAVIQWVNPAFTELTGYEPAEALGSLDARKLISKAALENQYPQIMDTLSKGEVWQGEIISLRKDGAEYYQDATITPVLNEQGVFNRFIAVMQDVTLRKQTEDQIRESEERFRLVTQVTVHAVWDWDLHSNQIWWGEGLRTTFNHPSGMSSQDPQWRLSCIHPEDRSTVEASILDAIGHGVKVWSKEYRFKRGDGTYANVFDRAHVLYDSKGIPYRMLGAIMDISERKQAEDELVASEQKFRAIFENIEDVVYQTDYHGIVTAISPSVTKQAGYSPGELIGKHAKSFYESAEEFDALDALITEKGTLNDHEVRIIKKDGSVAYVSMTIRTVFDAKGNPVGTEGVMRNVSERKKAQAMLDRKNRILSALNRTSLELMHRLELKDVLQNIVDQAIQLVDTPHGYLYLFDEAQDELVEEIGTGIFGKFKGFRLKRGEGLSGKVLETGQPLMIADYHAWDQRSKKLDDLEFHAIAGVPLTVSSKVVGVLGLSYLEPDRFFTEEDVELLTGFAQLASIALDNARLHDLIQKELTARNEAEGTLRRLTDNMQDVVTQIGAEGNILYASPSHKWVLGVDPKEVLGVSIFERIHPDDLDEAFKILSQAYNEARPPDLFALRYQHASGRYIWMECSSNLLTDSAGEFAGAVLSSRDVTQRKEIEAALRESENLYRLLTENSSDVIWVRDMNLQFTYVSPAIQRLQGYTVEESMNSSMEHDLAPESFEYARKFFTEIVHGLKDFSAEDIRGQYRTLELELVKKDGSTVWTESQMSFLLDEHGQPTGILGVTRDITERRRAANQLRSLNADLENRVRERTTEIQESNKYLSALLDTAIVLNKNLNLDELLDHIMTQAHAIVACRAVNLMLIQGDHAYIARRLGYKGLEKIERNLLEYRFPLDWPNFARMIRTESGIHISDTKTEPTWQKIQSSEWVRSYIGLPLLAGGKVIGFLNFSHNEPNFFPQKEYALLEAFANQVSVAIQNARLLEEVRQSLEKEQDLRDKLVSSEKLAALGKMVAVIAHEINNPIQTVKNTFYLLQDQVPPDSPASEYVKIASMEASRISNLVNQLRETYRPKSKKLSLVDVPRLINEVYQLMTPQLSNSGVECVVRETDRSCVVLGYPDGLKQVFINLCMNAVEAMAVEKGGRITVDYEVKMEDNWLGVSFHNTGPAIPKEALYHIFEPFFTTKGSGSGLGLSICFDIVKQHSGEITVENSTAGGVKFTVWLPLASEQEKDDARQK